MRRLHGTARLAMLVLMRSIFLAALILAPVALPGRAFFSLPGPAFFSLPGTGFFSLPGPARAQSWPNETGISRDGFRGSIDALDRFRQADNPRLRGEEGRARIGGWLGDARGWLESQYDKVGERETEPAPHFNLRREWEGDLGRRR